jgi:hypothetical protein
MISNEWFQRSWIFQEIALATQLILQYGDEKNALGYFWGCNVDNLGFRNSGLVFGFWSPV